MLLSLDSPHDFDPVLNTLRSLLTRGRHAEADRLAQSHRRRVSQERMRGFLALRAEIALGLGRFTAALEWSSAALRGIDPRASLTAVPESSRIRALIGLGRFREAEAHLEGRFAALDPLGVELSLFRAQVALHSGGLALAAREASNACDRAVARRQRGRLVEALLLRARTLREEGNTPGARADIDRARRLANGLRDASSLAGVLADRADLMAHSGDWTEAARDAGQSARLFARALSPHEHLSAGRRTGLLGLAQGEPGAALPAIERAADLARRGFGTVECRAEIDLLLADAQLAGRDPEGALERATAALSFFRSAQDPGGLARAHVRRSLAALSASNPTLAFREARIAGSITNGGPVAQGLSDIALGRVLLRKERCHAVASFDRALRNPSLYPPLRSVAQLGLALAEGASPQGDAVQASLSAVEAFGDLRILAIVRSDLKEMFGVEPGVASRHGLAVVGVRSGVEERRDADQGAALSEFLPGLFGESEPVRRLSGLVRKAAPSSLPVAIYGETGTGKEKVARAIHDLSPRKDREFVALNAASLSDELFESELFGHVRGSFTGALADRPGLVEKAKGGTLFIDEVADLSPRSQVRLLRFVEGGVYRRVGENHERRSDVRIVVASNQRLEDLVAAGRFREDLLHRLRGVCLSLPPLRERGRDILHLARHFVEVASSGAVRLSLPSEARLREYPWPGNVRELEQEMRRAVVLSDSLAIEWRGPESTAGSPPRAGEAGTGTVTPLHEAMGGFERKHLKSVLSRCLERVEAARLLGISRQALHQKIVRYGL
ncbi:MAG TPA: sigma 54-interacting transcriptional regulator [Vicinamibacteria bacterium]|nr:sigma 54-interacting transcriptional regulator [Vicinamibacteria bacterium]